MTSFLLYILIAFAAVSVQATFFTGIRPDLVLVITCFYALRAGRGKGLVYGALAGVLVDAVNGLILGPHMLGKSLAAYYVRTMRNNMFQWNGFINLVSIILFSSMNVLVVWLCFSIFTDISFVNRSIWYSVKEVIFTVFVSILLYPVFRPHEDVSEG
jgi:rod shape-determining protein MreD